MRKCVPEREHIVCSCSDTVKFISSAIRQLNLIGPRIRKLRNGRGWTQDVLAQKLQLAGWDVSRTSIAKLESRLRWVSDCELLFLAKIFTVELHALFPDNVNLKKIGPQFRS